MAFKDSINLGVPDAMQSIKDAAGIVTNLNNSHGTIKLPWEISGINSKFFKSIQIDPNRWDQLFPYRLLVIDATTKRVIQGTSSGLLKSASITYSPGTSSALVSFGAEFGGWVFQLPISPQQLSIQDQFAIQTSATLRGVLEEHSGVRFKTINASGTMGVWAQRESINKPPGTPGIIQSLFGGTIQAAGTVVNQVSGIINSATTNHPANKPVSLLPATSTVGPTSVGYYQALKLQQFLEQYAEAKKDPANASWRLVFDIPKQKQSFVVTPVAYNWLQNANKPMEIMYNFQLKAWRRIDLDQAPRAISPNNQPLTPGILQRVLATLAAARSTLSASLNLIGAVRSDVETPIDALRQTALFVKSLAGTSPSVADLPSQKISEFASSTASSIATQSTSIASTNSNGAVRESLNLVVQNQNQNEGLSANAVANGQLGNLAALNQSLNPANAVFNKPLGNFTLLDQVSVSSLSLNAAQQAAVDKILDDARQTTVDTLKQYRATIQQLALQLSNSFGTGSAYYNQIYGLPPPTPRLQPITLDEYDILKSLYDTLTSYDILTATTEIDDNNVQTNMEYVAGLATTAGIPFQTSISKVLAPVPFGLTIEEISARYLGDPQRWQEISTLNGLRDPYIDEDGFQLDLLSNATGRQITVASDTNLYVGQKVVLRSTTQMPAARSILDIDRLSDTSFLLTMDGLPDLDSFVTADNAYLQAYLPGTVNSQQKIFIPSDLPVSDDSSITPPASTSSDPLTGLSKVDWLLNDSGDLAVNNYGDFRYSNGITNIIQALRIKFGTQLNTVLLHPNFGLGVKVGTISSEIQIQDLYNSINTMIQQDPRFTGVSNLQIKINGPTLGISLAVQLPNQTGVFPISFALTA